MIRRGAAFRLAYVVVAGYCLPRFMPAQATADTAPPLVKADIEARRPRNRTAAAGAFESRKARIALAYDATDRSDLAGQQWSYTVPFKLTIGAAVSRGTLTLSRTATEDVYESVMLFNIPNPTLAATLKLELDDSPATTTATGSVPASIALLLITESVRVTVFDPTQPATKPTLTVNTSGFAWWHPIAGAMEYDLEWVTVDNQRVGLNSPTDWFAVKSPARVTIGDTAYQLPMNAPASRVYARVRAVGRYPGYGQADAPARIVGRWATAPFVAAAGLEPNKSWLLQTSFAEGGRRTPQISYYDGLLRERQRVRVSTADTVALVSETKHDREGRAVLSIIPAPRGVRDTALTYAEAFNRDAAGALLGAEDFASGQADPPALSQLYGAGKYYSPNNQIGGPHSDYIPAANGYVFTLTELTRDATSRVRRAGGLGDSLRLGGNHEQQYLYGTANSTQLHRMFGSQVGLASHYRRNVSRDENGQGSVAYLDDKGRTIATALVGKAPDNLVALSSNVENTATYSLNDNNQIDRTAGESRSVNRIMNTEPRLYTFTYAMTGVNYGVDTGDPASPYCAGCSYELTLWIVDPNGNAVDLVDPAAPPSPGTVAPKLISRTFGPVQTSTCHADMSTAGAAGNVTFDATFASLGEYTVTKVLRLVSGAVEAQVASYVATPGVVDVQHFVDDALGDVDPTQCFNSCEDYCRGSTTTAQEMDNCVKGCQNLIAASFEDLERQFCENIAQSILTDVSPGGKYFEDPTWLAQAVSNVNAAAPGTIPADTPEGVAAVWRSDWAALLANEHPEDCHSDVCAANNLIRSKVHDDSASLVHTYAEALAGGWLNPRGMSPTPRGPPSSVASIDPYFASGGFGYKYRNKMRDTLAGFEKTQDGTAIVYSLWQFVADPNKVYGPGSGVTAVPLDDQWRFFRGIYLGLKQQFHVKLMEDPNEYDCQYVDDPYAYFKKPVAFTTEAEVNAAQTEALQDYCGDGTSGLCEARSQQWREELVAACPTLTVPVADQIQTLLAQYCGQTCGLDNPLGILTPEALDQGHPILTQVQALLGECPLSAIAEDDPLIYGESCEAECKTSYEIHECAAQLVAAIDTALPRNVGQDIVLTPVDQKKLLPACSLQGMTPSLKMRIPDSLMVRLARDSTTCLVLFFDADGHRVPLSSLRDIIGTDYAPNAPNAIVNSTTGFTRLVITAILTNADTTKLWVFSNCGIPTIATKEECVKKEGAGHCTKELFDILRRRLPRALANSPVSVKDESECFDNFSASPAVASFVLSAKARKDKRCPDACQFSLFGARGGRILLSSVVRWGELEAEPGYPGPFQRDPIYGLPYAHFSLEVIIKVGARPQRVKAYVFSDCPLDREPICIDVPIGIETPPVDTTSPPDSLCIDDLNDEAEFNGTNEYKRTRGHIEAEFRDVQANRCFDPPQFTENFTYRAALREYHYTLFYYDQADNLVQTVPPEDAQLWTTGPDPQRYMPTIYRYNSRNQIQLRRTPDGGERRSWYNAAGQLRFTQTADQDTAGAYSYIKYDPQSRVVETGVVKLTSAQRDAGIESPGFPDKATFALSELIETAFDTAAISLCPGLNQQNLRGRISATAFEPLVGALQSATCYSYDPHGNVNTIVQVLDGLGPKRIDYAYDLISNKVKSTVYQQNQSDQMVHRYEYDQDARLVAVYTSRDTVIWRREARYNYYKHGPLARMELGEPVVQGVDYVHTLQGWLKGVNSNTLMASRDPGRDGDAMVASNPNKAIPVDAFGLTLGYFRGDYASAAGANSFEAATGGSGIEAASPSQFNGNPAHMVTAANPFVSVTGSPLGIAFRHDQLARLDTARAFANADTSTDHWGGVPANPDDYLAAFSYDANGNLLTLRRNGFGASLPRDNLAYSYPHSGTHLMSNRSSQVTDASPAGNYADDLDGAHSFEYDLRGNVKNERASLLETISWDGRGRLTSIGRTAGSGPGLSFWYNPFGERIARIVVPQGGVPTDQTYQYYVRGTNGQVLAIYQRNWSSTGGGAPTETVSLLEHPLYGTSRLGTKPSDGQVTAGPVFQRTTGRRYELRDQLDNVVSIVSDRRLGKDSDNDGIVDIYAPEILASYAYYPFGELITQRTADLPSYRFGYNGEEREDGIVGAARIYDFGARYFDARFGRFLSPDPLSGETPWYSPYLFAGNKPAWARDLGGKQECRESSCTAEVSNSGGNTELSAASPDVDPLPTISGERERRQNIMEYMPGNFEIADNPEAKSYAYTWRALPEYQEVTQHEALYDQAAARYGLNPDLLKAIAWMESTHGWYDRFKPGEPKSIRPMNVYAKIWSGLGLTQASIHDPRINIEAAAYIIANIQSRIENPTVEKVATLYNKLRETQVSNYGATVAEYYRDRPWIPRPPLPAPAPTIPASKLGPILLRHP